MFSIADPTLGISWRIGEAGEFRETGFIDTLDPRTRKRMPNPSIELAADAPAATIQVRYVDAQGELQGPFPIRFDPEAALIRDQRKILDMTATSWLSFREFNGLLVYYTHLMSYRCAIREVRVGIDTRGAGQGAEDAALRSEGSQRDSARGAALSEAGARDQIGLGGIDLSRRQRVGDQEFPALRSYRRMDSGKATLEFDFKQQIHVHILAAGGARGLRVVVPRKREQGMPDARCTRGLVCKMHE